MELVTFSSLQELLKFLYFCLTPVFHCCSGFVVQATGQVPNNPE